MKNLKMIKISVQNMIFMKSKYSFKLLKIIIVGVSIIQVITNYNEECSSQIFFNCQKIKYYV